MEMHELIHDQVRPRPPVVNIPENMQIVDREILDQAAEILDEVLRDAGGDDRTDDLVEIIFLVGVVLIDIQQLVDDIGKILRNLLKNLAAGIF